MSFHYLIYLLVWTLFSEFREGIFKILSSNFTSIIEIESFKNSSRKGQYAYLLTPRGIREKSLLTHRFIERKRQEFEELRLEIEALEKEMS